jgi:DNA invertase Pin-like site-specific DNA recombinase
MRIYGYHRTSTKEQHLDRGIKEIKDFINKNNLTIDEMFTDQQTGKNFNRPDYSVLKRIIKKDDVLIISELDRLGRNKEDTLKELQYFKNKGIRIMILEIPTTLIDMTKMDNVMSKMMMETINNMLIEMYASLAHAEMLKREKRQREGIEAMKARGEFNKYGRPGIEINDEFKQVYKTWKAGTIKAVEAMKQLDMSKATFYRKVKELEGGENVG